MASLYNKTKRTLRDILEAIRNEPLFELIKNVANHIPIYRNCFQMKPVFIGRSSTGKSTITNALLKRDCLPTGSTEITVNFFAIETTNKDHEYFVLTNRKSGLTTSENTNMSELKSIRRQNYKVTDFTNTDTVMKIYLDKENEFLKDGVVLVYISGYNRGHFETSQDADVFMVVIYMNEGSSEINAAILKQIIQISENGPICFIFNKCDHISSWGSRKINSNEEIEYLKFKTFYQNRCSTISLPDDDLIFDDIEGTLKKVYINENLLSKIIGNRKINATEKSTLDCLMTVLSILCELSDRSIKYARKIFCNNTIMKVLNALFIKCLDNTSRFSICEQLLESFVIIFVNLSKKDSLDPESIISNMRKGLQNKDLNDVIHTAMVLTLAHQCGNTFHDDHNMRKILEEKIKKAESNESLEWCGFSLSELVEGLQKLGIDEIKTMIR